jgi:hypothetical protein
MGEITRERGLSVCVAQIHAELDKATIERQNGDGVKPGSDDL